MTFTVPKRVFDTASPMSPPPKSLTLAVLAVISSLGLMLAVAAVGGAASNAGAGTGVAHSAGLLLSTAGIAIAAAILWIAARSLRRSLQSAKELRTGQIPQSRASAANARQDAFVALGLGLSLSIVLGLVLLMTMNDASIQQTFFNWGAVRDSATDVMKSFGLNVWIAVAAEAIVLVAGLALGVARMIPGKGGKPIRALAIAYIDVMRAVPAIIVLYLVGFGLPLVNIPVLSELPAEWFAVTALSLTYSAYVAEVYRSGIESVHPSQWSATRSLGFSYAQTLLFVVLPQAVRAVIPPLLTMFIALQKDTSLVNIIGTMDAFNQAKFYASSSFNLSSVTVVAALFVVITIPQTRFVDWMLARGAARRSGAKK
ncbi:amino acid ABC transporter permease [Arthrobacter sp. NPDC057013]|uniref:amino acid ABC transporter permease n=1 Tax=Arthrobacter sp. NPDC057013 TaxID=3345999 RepID=UPI0036251D1C